MSIFIATHRSAMLLLPIHQLMIPKGFHVVVSLRMDLEQYGLAGEMYTEPSMSMPSLLPAPVATGDVHEQFARHPYFDTLLLLLSLFPLPCATKCSLMFAISL
jgi:hypothetical protein